MAVIVQDHLSAQGVSLRLGDAVTGFEQETDGTITVRSKSGAEVAADLVILSIGVRPEVGLAKEAGLEIGARGGIRVDEKMRTSDPRIWAVGDAVEVKDAVTGQWTLIPLAGPANRQGRIAADVICGRESSFRGVQATSVCGVLGLTVATTGANEKSLQSAGLEYEKIYLHPGHHVGYYPGARPISIKLIFSPRDGRVLGMQAVGQEGVEKRVDVVAMAIQKRSTVFDLEEAELCYAPQFGAAKDPVNIAGMIASNIMRGDAPVAHWEDVGDTGALILDVRGYEEFRRGHVEGAVNVPLGELRTRMDELPRNREVWVYCGVGQRSYYATRAMLQYGFKMRNLSGGFQTFVSVSRR
jgi:rhodanese-related sulfurtransferase